jgi:hypothetical protein
MHFAHVPRAGHPFPDRCVLCRLISQFNGLGRESDGFAILTGAGHSNANDHAAARAVLVDLLDDSVKSVETPWNPHVVSYHDGS